MGARDELDQALHPKRTGDLDAAVLALEALLGRRPAHPLALAHLADVQIRRGRIDEATAALDRAEEAAGTTTFTSRLRGDLHYRAGRFRDAARAYEVADALGEKGAWHLVQLARCRLRLRDLEGARGAALRAVEREPSQAAGWLVLGDVAAREQRFAVAEDMYSRAHDAAPGDGFAYAKLVEARLLRLPPEARSREVEVLLKTTGRGNRHLEAVLARMRSAQGDTGAAAEAWGHTAAEHGDPYSRRMHGFSLRKAGRLDEAAAVLGRCLADEPHNIPVFRAYIAVQRDRGAFEELRRTLEAILPRAGARRGAYYGELRKLPAPRAPDTESGSRPR